MRLACWFGHDLDVAEPLLTHNDVTTIMKPLGDLRDDVRFLRRLFEEDDGEEEEEDPEADA